MVARAETIQQLILTSVLDNSAQLKIVGMLAGGGEVGVRLENDRIYVTSALQQEKLYFIFVLMNKSRV